MNFSEYLEEVRTAIQSTTALPDGAVSVYQQQDLVELVNNAIALHSCAVIVTLTSGQGTPDSRATTGPVQHVLEVEVWTPYALTSGQTLTSLQVAEWLMAGLHGFKPDDVPASNGGSRILAFRRMAMRGEGRQGDAPEYMVGNVQFEVRLVPQARP